MSGRPRVHPEANSGSDYIAHAHKKFLQRALKTALGAVGDASSGLDFIEIVFTTNTVTMRATNRYIASQYVIEQEQSLGLLSPQVFRVHATEAKRLLSLVTKEPSGLVPLSVKGDGEESPILSLGTPVEASGPAIIEHSGDFPTVNFDSVFPAPGGYPVETVPVDRVAFDVYALQAILSVAALLDRPSPRHKARRARVSFAPESASRGPFIVRFRDDERWTGLVMPWSAD